MCSVLFCCIYVYLECSTEDAVGYLGAVSSGSDLRFNAHRFLPLCPRSIYSQPDTSCSLPLRDVVLGWMGWDELSWFTM